MRKRLGLHDVRTRILFAAYNFEREGIKENPPKAGG